MPERVLVHIERETVNDESVRILSWKFASGSWVEKGQLICEAETSKAVMEINAPEAGTLVYEVPAGNEVPVGAAICEIVPEGASPARVPETLPVAKAAIGQDDARAREDLPPARLTPLALKLAAEFGFDISAFAPGTLVRRNDILRKAGQLPPEVFAAGPVTTAPARKPVPVNGVPLDWTDLPRRKILEGNILAAGRAGTIPSSVTTACLAPRLRARAERLGFRSVGFTALVVFETARLLRKYPIFNAICLDRRVGHYSNVNIGWAIDGGQKLVVPVIPLADRKTIAEIASLMEEQLEAYVDNSLGPAAFAGGTFTVTDLSGDGVSFFQPLIGQGQSAILGIGADLSRGAGETFYLTLVFDHQLAEGRTAAKFLGELRERLEAHSAVEGSRADSALPEPEPYCLLCQRDSATLKSIKAILLKSEVPAGCVCSVCAAGWL